MRARCLARGRLGGPGRIERSGPFLRLGGEARRDGWACARCVRQCPCRHARPGGRFGLFQLLFGEGLLLLLGRIGFERDALRFAFRELGYVLVEGLFFVPQGRIYVIVAAEPGVVVIFFVDAPELMW